MGEKVCGGSTLRWKGQNERVEVMMMCVGVEGGGEQQEREGKIKMAIQNNISSSLLGYFSCFALFHWQTQTASWNRSEFV